MLVAKITFAHGRAASIAPSLPHNLGGPMPNPVPNPAKFVSFMDGGFTVPPDQGITDNPPPHEAGIPIMRDLDKDHDAFLAFKYKTENGKGTVSVTLNAVTIKIPFGDDSVVPRVWYETIGGGRLHKPPEHNELVVKRILGTGTVTVSDFKIFYHTE